MGTHDADWMERWRRGDGAAFEALVERWRRPVARFLFRYTGRADRVQDLCQEVFLRVYQVGRPLPRERHVPMLAVPHRAERGPRRRPPRRRDPAPLNGAEPADLPRPAEMLCRRRELAAALARAAAELPEPMRVVLALRHDEGLSFEEIARLTGRRPARSSRASPPPCARLRARLEQLGYGPEEITP